MKLDMRKIIDSLKTRSFRVGGYSIVAAAIVLAIAIAVNCLAGALPASMTQIDITANQLSTISRQTESIVGAIDTDVTIYWVVQEGAEDATLRTLLERYKSLSKHIRVEQKDPDVYPTFIEQYTTGSIYNNSLIVESGERYRYVSYEEIYVYDTSNYYYDGSYTVNFDGESALTSAIDYVVSQDVPKVYTITGHGEGAVPSSFSAAVEKENIELSELSLLTENQVPEDADTIFIYSPQSDISEDEKRMLEDYLAGGGKLILVSDPPREETLTNLEALMAGYGVTAAEGVVVEGSQSNYGLGTPYYLLPTLASHDITAPLKENGYYVMLPVAQGLQVSSDLPDGIAVTQLLTTSSSAFSKLAGYNLTTYEKEDGDIEGPFALAVYITDENIQSSVLWISSGALLDEQTNARSSGGNQDFFLNALNYLVEPESSNISIRAKDLSMEYLTIDSATASVLTILTLFIIPLAYLAAGIVIWIRRKRR